VKIGKVDSLQLHVDIWVMETHQGQLPTPSAHPYVLQAHMHLIAADDQSQEKNKKSYLWLSILQVKS